MIDIYVYREGKKTTIINSYFLGVFKIYHGIIMVFLTCTITRVPMVYTSTISKYHIHTITFIAMLCKRAMVLLLLCHGADFVSGFRWWQHCTIVQYSLEVKCPHLFFLCVCLRCQHLWEQHQMTNRPVPAISLRTSAVSFFAIMYKIGQNNECFAISGP